MYIYSQLFLVVGISKSGFFASKYLLQKSAKCYIYDDSKDEKINTAIIELESLGAIKIEKEVLDKVLKEIDVVILSPGVPINHEIAVKAKQLNKRIVGELEFGFIQFMPTIVAITGTNGKTTTVSLLNHILDGTSFTHKMVGNIGTPITSVIDKKSDDILIAEVSSFQLESISFFCPHISCILNISPDHLERHYTMENYIFLKKRITKNQRESEYAVLNYDDEIVRGFCDTRAKIIWISTKEKVSGCYILDDKIYYNEEYIIDANQISINGIHNLYNAMFSTVCAKLLGIDRQEIVQGLTTFGGVKHRLERVKEYNGIFFYNDSKATNTASCISAIEYIKTPTVLILGGSEKGENYDLLFNRIKESSVKYVIITGASRINMFNSAVKNKVKGVSVVEDFKLAIKSAYMIAEKGDSILFSPACASFDNFHNFEERGEEFCKCVESLIESNT